MSVTAAVVAADMGFPAVFMIVVFTMHIGIESKIAGNKSIYRFIGITFDTAVELYSVFCQRHLCTAANTAANEYICFYSGEYAGQCTVTGAVGIYKLCFNDLAVFNIVQFELLGVTEMLKDISVLVSYCDSHNICSFFDFEFFLNLPFDAVFFIAKVCTAATKLNLAALNFQCEAKHKCVCYLFPCGFIDFLCGCSAYAELCPAFFLA